MPERIVGYIGGLGSGGEAGLHGFGNFPPRSEIVEHHFGHAAEVGGLALHEERGSVGIVLVTSVGHGEQAESRQAIEQRLRPARRDADFLGQAVGGIRISFERGENAVSGGGTENAAGPTAGDQLQDFFRRWSVHGRRRLRRRLF
jgi:hypothetical protein